MLQCGPCYREKGRDNSETKRRSLKKTAASSPFLRFGITGTRPARRVPHLFGVKLQTERPNMVWPAFDLVLAVSLRGSRITNENE